MKVLPHVLLNKDPFANFGNFFNSFQDKMKMDNEQMTLCFTWHHKNETLPKFLCNLNEISKIDT